MPRPRLLFALAGLTTLTMAIAIIIENPPQYDVTGLLALTAVFALLTVAIRD
jgi:uncharacterized membrane protein YqjE